MNFNHATGYGVPADSNGEASHLVSPKIANIPGDSIGNITSYERGYYGSLGNGNVDTYNNSINILYDELDGYETRGSHFSPIGPSPQSQFYDTEGDVRSCDECRIDSEATVILSADRVPHSSDDAFSGGEQTYYSPLVEHNMTGVASSVLVGWNILNLLLSLSLLALPFAVWKAGLIVIVLLVVIALITNYTSRILISMMYEDSAVYNAKKVRVRVDYADLGQDVLNSTKGAWLVQTVQTFEMLGICVLNICVLGSLTKEIFPTVSIQLCTVIVAVLAFPTFFIRKLAVIGWMQTISVFSLAIGLILVQIYCLMNVSQWNVSTVFVKDYTKVPIAIGIIIYAFGIHGVIPGLEEQMRRPKRFGFVTNVTFCFTLFVQCLFSFTNASFYGADTDQVITIDLEKHVSLGISTACFIGLSILLHFSLPTFVVLERLDNVVHSLFPCCPSHGENRFHTLLSVCLRILVIAVSVGLAVWLPYFAYLMAFTGSAMTSVSALILPCCFHIKLRHSRLSWFQILFDVMIVLFGFACLLLGTIYSVLAICNEATS